MFNNLENDKTAEPGLKQYLSPVAVWALSFGCAVGWGSFVMPGTTFLPVAGPVGTTVGIILGAVVMLIIGANYHYMMNRFPDSGGTYSYSKHEFGYDHGFLSAWFLILVYVAIIWANATALPLIFRNLFGSTFQFGFHYTIAGFDVYMGEVLLSVSGLVVFGLICIRGRRLAVALQTVMAFILIGGVVIGFIAAVYGTGGGVLHITPGFVPQKSSLVSILNIIVLAPWAFAGFESISNSAEEFKFSAKKSLSIMSIAVICSAAAYIFLALLAVSVLPKGYPDWISYINDIGNLSGLEGLPTFHAVNALMGKTGLIILLFTVLVGVITGLVGNYIAAGRLIYSLAKDDLIPEWFGKLNSFNTPKNAILFVMLISLPIPFLGRTAIGWIVDVNTIGATIAYAYTSATAYRKAKDENHTRYMLTGAAGTIISVLFFLYFMIPNFWTVSALSTESYMILIAWSILGVVFFRYIFERDSHKRLGKSTIVWIVLLFLIFFTSMMWVRQATHNVTKEVLHELNEYNESEMNSFGIEMTEEDRDKANSVLEEKMSEVNSALTRIGIVQMILIVLALFIMFNIYNSMMSRERDAEISMIKAEENSRAKSVFLSNMSHDIRTPMNAIIGYTALAKKVEDNPAETAGYLDKIDSSSQHLLALINDVLEMSRIESGKMELSLEKTDLVKSIEEVKDLFTVQMDEKQIVFTAMTEIKDRFVLCDKNRLNRVLLNLVSNAYKFTPENGMVTLMLKQTSSSNEECSYEIRVRDSGMGMSTEFAGKVFEAYSRERTAEKIEGTGLGMGITKSFVDLMGGTILVESKQGVGTEFVIDLAFAPAPDDLINEESSENEEKKSSFRGMKLLLVDDNEINRDIAATVLLDEGFVIETAENGKQAYDIIAGSTPGEFSGVLMDVQMPEMNGYDATRAIRKLSDPVLSKIPIVAMTANAFAEDIQNAKEAGLNGHIAKPFDTKKLLETLADILS